METTIGVFVGAEWLCMQDKQDRLNGIIEGDTHLINTSTMTEAGLADLKEYACGKLLEFRVNGKVLHPPLHATAIVHPLCCLALAMMIGVLAGKG